MRFDLKGFEPDANNTTPGIIVTGFNFIPTLNGYKTGKAPADVGMDALASDGITAVVAELLDGSRRLFAGTADKLFERNGTAWTDRSGSVYAATKDSPWEFAQFGNSTIAVTAANNMQRSTGAGFTDLVAIKAKHVCAVKGFVIAAGTDEATYGKQDDRWWCSALNNETDWTPSIATQCATGRLVDSPGEILAIKTLGQDLVVYKDSSIYVGRYSGPPGVWEWRLIPGRVGVSSPNAIVDIGNAHLFIGREDLYLFDGNYPIALNSPIKEWFYDRISTPYMSRVFHVYDPYESMVYFFFATSGSASGETNDCLVYNHKANKFGRFSPLYGLTTDNLRPYVGLNFIGKTTDGWSPGYTWDTLPIVGKTWDDWPNVTYDSHYWSASERSPAYFAKDKKIYSISATPGDSKIELWSIGTEDDRPPTLRRIRPIFRDGADNSGTMIAQVWGKGFSQDIDGSRNLIAGKHNTLTNGKIDVLATSPFITISLDMNGAMELVGLDLDLVGPSGKR